MTQPTGQPTGAPPDEREPRKPRPKRRRITEVDTDLLELTDTRIHEPQRVAASPHGMVSTAHYSATAAGVRMLEQGGNAVDAAIAAALALGVCEPAASGLGGQTMLLIHLRASGSTVAIDGSSRAPNRALIESFANLRAERRRGHLATTVPSSPATYAYALERYGRLDWAAVLEPAIELAEQGYEISVLQYRLTRRERRHLQAHPAGPLFLQDGRRVRRAGTKFVQPVLADTLRRLGEKGYEDFYLGETARLMHEDMEVNGGILREDDLAQIPVPIEREPLSGRFGRDQLFTMPLPAAGRTLVELLNIHRSLPRELRDIDTPDGAVCLARAIQRAPDRSQRSAGRSQSVPPGVGQADAGPPLRPGVGPPDRTDPHLRRDHPPIGDGLGRQRGGAHPVDRERLRIVRSVAAVGLPLQQLHERLQLHRPLASLLPAAQRGALGQRGPHHRLQARPAVARHRLAGKRAHPAGDPAGAAAPARVLAAGRGGRAPHPLLARGCRFGGGFAHLDRRAGRLEGCRLRVDPPRAPTRFIWAACRWSWPTASASSGWPTPAETARQQARLRHRRQWNDVAAAGLRPPRRSAGTGRSRGVVRADAARGRRRRRRRRGPRSTRSRARSAGS